MNERRLKRIEPAERKGERTIAEGGEVRLGFEELGDGFRGRFHDSVQHVDDSLLRVVIGRHQPHAVGRVHAVRCVVHVDADLCIRIFSLQHLNHISFI